MVLLYAMMQRLCHWTETKGKCTADELGLLSHIGTERVHWVQAELRLGQTTPAQR